jgi:hypothetical protein
MKKETHYYILYNETTHKIYMENKIYEKMYNDLK